MDKLYYRRLGIPFRVNKLRRFAPSPEATPHNRHTIRAPHGITPPDAPRAVRASLGSTSPRKDFGPVAAGIRPWGAGADGGDLHPQLRNELIGSMRAALSEGTAQATSEMRIKRHTTARVVNGSVAVTP
jgi:hypothetical protein